MEGGVPAPPEAALAWVAEAAGSPVVALEELTGGRWHANHVVTLRDGRELVLRRWAHGVGPPHWPPSHRRLAASA